MKPKILIACLSFILLWCHQGSAQTASRSGLDDQTAVYVTVYNNNLGLIKDLRQVSLAFGQGELRFMDIAAHIMPQTVHVKSLNYPQGFTVLEQNYEYDLMNATKLLDKYVGQKIKIIDWNKYQDRTDQVDAILLSNNQGQIYRINDEIFLGHPGYKVLPKLPQNLIAKPTLTWLYENTIKKPHRLEVSYLTTNMSWKADYVLVLNQEDTAADITAWVTLDNKSGTVYKNARLKLVAGDVHRVKQRPPQRLYAMKAAQEVRSPQFKEKAFFEYHIYELQRKTTLKDKQTKQVKLLEASGIKIQKELLVYGIRSYFNRQFRPRNPKQPVNVYIKFINSKNNNLGIPLPAGIMRLYKQDDDGSQQFVGEDRIEHTPKDESLKLKIGEAFDVVARRIQTDYRRITTQRHESEWEISLHNHKAQAVAIGVIEPLIGNWKVISNSHPYQKVDAATIRFDVNVPKEGSLKIRYRVQVGI